ncbi:hypothetical protein [Agrobacterium tumefaciens]|uniref:hypothetical protein n=1 Tax=Agrobacterium tumefaciens TaxID=358 RepID=UPI003BA031C0
MTIEGGATLLHSLGIQGDVVTMLYGAGSDLAKMQERLTLFNFIQRSLSLSASRKIPADEIVVATVFS